MEFDSNGSSPDAIHIDGQTIEWTQGRAFSFFGPDTVATTTHTHPVIFNALKGATGDNIKHSLKDYDVELYGEPLNDVKLDKWRTLIDALEYRSVAKMRAISYSGRVWKDLHLKNIGTTTVIAFWIDQTIVRDGEYLATLVKYFNIKNKILWIGTDSRTFNEFDPNADSVDVGDTKLLKSAIAPHLSHDQILDMLLRAHSDIHMTPFERRVVRDVMATSPATVKAVTGGYPTPAEYQYRSKFSESFAPLLNINSAFDRAVKKLLDLYNK